MAGMDPKPGPLSESALVLIDCQMEYVDGLLLLAGVETALAEAAKLVDLARANGVPVIHVQHKGRSGGAFDPDGPAFKIAPAVAPIDGEAAIEKLHPNAFAGTDLKDRLDDAGVLEVIVAGFMTHMCVSTTVRAASEMGLRCTVVADACATRDLPDGLGGVVSAADVHRAELAALSDRFATVIPGADDLSP